MMAHRVAAERADLIAAAASVAGSLNLDRIAPSRPVAVLQIHSVDDPRALYDGGLGPPFPGTDNRVQHAPVQGGLDRWIAANGCGTAPDTVESRSGRGGTPTVAQTAVLMSWRGCRGGVVVSHWRLTGSGHGWPGDAAPAGGERLVGPQSTVVDAADEVWRFVSQFRR
jgi:polyhydroxybutyrate depolymerase